MIRIRLFTVLRTPCLAAVAALAVLGSGCQRSETIENPSVAPVENTGAVESVGTVTVEVIPSSEEPTESTRRTVSIQDGQTLESVMRELAKQKDEPLELAISGEGATAFIQSINSIPTDANRGWTYTIDGEFATKGIGSLVLQPGQTIQWRFTTFEEAMKSQE